MNGLLIALVVVAALVLLGLALSVRIVQQYEKGVLFRLGRVVGGREPGLTLLVPLGEGVRGVLFRLGRGVGVREPGLTLIVPLVEVLRRVSLRIVTMPIQSQGIITRDNVSVDVSAVAHHLVS